MDFKEKLNGLLPDKGELILYWLGQAGFIVKNSQNQILVLDPYLSDAVERICGLKRLMMPVIEGSELNPDYVLITHHDEDHLDMDVIPNMMNRNPDSVLLAPSGAYEMCLEGGVNQSQVICFNEGNKRSMGGYNVEAVFADHGDHAPEAIGYIVETEGHTIYFTGDTSYQIDRMKYAYSRDIDILVVPINGEYGNMNGLEAAELAKVCKPKVVIPSHFWTFVRHGGEPYLFDREMRIEVPDVSAYFMCQGEAIFWDGNIVKSC